MTGSDPERSREGEERQSGCLFIPKPQRPCDGKRAFADHSFGLDLSREGKAWLWEERMYKCPWHAWPELDTMAPNMGLSVGSEISTYETIREHIRIQLCHADTSQKETREGWDECGRRCF